MEEPYLITGNSVLDERGKISFVNDFTFQNVKRFYCIQNHETHFVRAWQGHKHEAKYFTVLQGSAIIGAVKINNWQNPAQNLPVETFQLSENNPSVLYIPKGYANGMMNVDEETKILVFATSTLAETKVDDFRWKPFYWDPWTECKKILRGNKRLEN